MINMHRNHVNFIQINNFWNNTLNIIIANEMLGNIFVLDNFLKLFPKSIIIIFFMK